MRKGGREGRRAYLHRVHVRDSGRGVLIPVLGLVSFRVSDLGLVDLREGGREGGVRWKDGEEGGRKEGREGGREGRTQSSGLVSEGSSIISGGLTGGCMSSRRLEGGREGGRAT
jgi:hypothetical protein